MARAALLAPGIVPGVLSEVERALTQAGVADPTRVTEAALEPGAACSIGRLVAILPADQGPASRLLGLLSASRNFDFLFIVVPLEAPPIILEKAAEIADDFLCWPAADIELKQRLRRLSGNSQEELEDICSRLTVELGVLQVVGRDRVFLEALQKLIPIARSDAPVLIVGETGTGKEVFARAIHHLSARRNRPFIPVDCGAIPHHLIENELFGHERGAYTDARSEQKGLVGLAEGGTLLLDEVDALSFAAQSKLLRFLQERAYRPLGSESYIRSNVNVIAATNLDLEEAVEQKLFRSDLYFRLNVLQIRLPPLRERPGDIAPLAEHFLRVFSSGSDSRPKTLSPGAVRKLEAYRWPGNVRELCNVIQRACVFSTGPHLAPSDIALRLPEPPRNPEVTFRQARLQAIEAFERDYVAAILRQCEGNITRAARRAGKERRAFGRLVQKYRLNSRVA